MIKRYSINGHFQKNWIEIDNDHCIAWVCGTSGNSIKEYREIIDYEKAVEWVLQVKKTKKK